MAGLRSLEQGIKAIQQGQLEEGARLLRIALKDTNLSGTLCATAYIWLAETKTDAEEKRRCYQEALNADPGNEHAKKRLAALLESELPPMPQQTRVPLPPDPIQTVPAAQPTLRAQPVSTPPDPVPPVIHHTPQNSVPRQTGPLGQQTRLFRTVGILDGPSGPGTGFFIKVDGLIATTRLVTGGKENLTIEIEPRNHIPGRVVRSFPEFDLSLIQVDMHVTTLLPFTLITVVPENMDLTTVAHNGKALKGRCRATKRDMKAHWFPTTFRQAPDMGGGPIFDDRNFVVGMLTRNASRVSPDLFGLHISVIRNCADLYQQEIMTDPNRTYCPSCGFLSRAAAVGAFYCETCGSILPHARAVNRFPVPAANPVYNENIYRACRHCGARVGYYNGACLRCGKPV